MPPNIVLEPTAAPLLRCEAARVCRAYRVGERPDQTVVAQLEVRR
jgi:hypothetical protein